MSRTKHRHPGGFLALCSLLALVACEDEKKPSSTSGDGGVSDQPAIDPNIAKAMAAASARRGTDPGSTPGGPPSAGVFDPGAADKEMPRGAAPRITLGSEGGQPRASPGAMQPKPGFKRNMSMQILLRSGRQAMPPLDFAFTLQAQKAKAAPAAAGGVPAEKPPASEASAAESVSMLATVQSVRVAPSQAMSIPKDVADQLGALKGSRVDFSMLPNGGGDGFRYTLSKAADPGLENVLRSAEIIVNNGSSDVVGIGSKVTIVEDGEDAEEVYTIVGAAEANPDEGKISHVSPIGSALLGAKKGDKVRVQTPGGSIIFNGKKVS